MNEACPITKPTVRLLVFLGLYYLFVDGAYLA